MRRATTPFPLHPLSLFDSPPKLQGAQSIAVNALLAERASANNSSVMLDEFNDLAGQVLGALRGQRTVMKSAHRRVLDVAASLGVSSSLMRMIERRTTGDKIVVYGGMVVVVGVIVLAWWWTKR